MFRGSKFRVSQTVLVLACCLFLVFATVAFQPAAAGGATAPALIRTNPNLIFNAHFGGRNGWTVINNDPGTGFSAYDPSVTRLPGSGSIKLLGNNTSVQSRPVPVVPGHTYTISNYMMAQKIPVMLICIAVAMDDSGNWLRQVSDGYYSAARVGAWEEMASFYEALPGESLLMMSCGRYQYPYNPNSDAAIWLDDTYLGEGESLEQPPTPKRAFDGGVVSVDELGNFEVNRNGTWEPFFPFGIYQAPRESYSSYSAHGFNCIMFNQFGLRAVEAARRAVSGFNAYGMMSMIEIAQYTNPRGSAYNNVADVGRQVVNLVRSGSSSNVLAYYWDNEAWSEYAAPQAITDEIKLRDRDESGRRLHPILMLQGNSGMLRQYNDMVDVAMTYDSYGGNLLLQRVEQQRLPWSLAVLSGITDPDVLRSRLYGELALGARGIAYYSDPVIQNGVPGPHIETLPVWWEFPKLRSEIDQLLPLLRQPAWTGWSVTLSCPGVTVGSRDYRGEGYMIVASDRPDRVHCSVALANLPYPAHSLVDYFSAQCFSLKTSGEFDIPLAGHAAAVYRVAAEPCQASR